jgi:ATP-dependent Zn protease
VIVDGKAPSSNANQVDKKQQVTVKKETKRSQSSSYLRWFLLVLTILGVCVFVTFAYVLWRTYQNQGGKSRR